MWKRDEAVKPGAAPAESPRPETPRSSERDIVNVNIGTIGKSVVIKGELSASEDLTIEGHVEGKIELKQNILTIGPNGRIKAAVFAKSVIVQGEVNGNISASEKVDIRDNGSVDGDLSSPRVAIAEGAHFRGSIDMQRTGGKPGDAKDAKPSAETPKPATPGTAPSVVSSTPTGTPAPAGAPTR
jgi:cytoskeletal protein CcmA (bactofilin family)